MYATVALLAGFFFHPNLASIQLTIFMNGAPVGESNYETSADGGFQSKTTLTLGSIKIATTASGHIVGGRLKDYESSTDGPTGTVKLALSKGKLTATVNGRSQEYPFEDKTGILAGNLHPQFTSYSLTAAEKALSGNPAVKTTSLSAYFVDLGSIGPVKVTLLPGKPLTVNGIKHSARRYSTDFGGVTAEYVMDESNEIVAMDVPTQKLRMIAKGWEGLFVDPLAKYPELSQPTFKTKMETGVKVRMRDGIELVCDVVRPDDGDKHPTILVRTPYGRGSETVNGTFYASRGYAYIAQDCRGREESAGNWDPFVNEGPDGFDTITWIANQPWSDGKVGMIGGSYAGYVQWAAAVLNPIALKCIVPQVSPPDAMRNIPYDHGVFALYPDLWWARIVAGRKTDFAGIRATLPSPGKLTTLPLSKVDDAVLGQDLPFFNKWLQRPALRDWKGFDYPFQIANSRVPALHVSGTWDGDEIGTHLNWETMRKLGRKDQWIVFGPWVHAFNTTHRLGDIEYGPDAIIEIDSLYLRWFDTWLKGKSVGLERQPRVRLFVTGANKWIDLPDWPAPTTPLQTLYLSKAGLVSKASRAENKTYTYDPSKDTDVADVANAANEAKATTKVDPKYLRNGQYFLLKSQPFKGSVAIASPCNVTLHFTSSAKDTDFFVAVLDIDPSGEMRVVGQPGKLRASYLKSLNGGLKLQSGKEYVATIPTWDFAHELPKGHRLGLLIRSSMFPIYARNLGTGEPIDRATRMVRQRNTILMGKGQASSISYHVLWQH